MGISSKVMFFTHAIVRLPGENFAQGITSANLGPPSLDMMLSQHNVYIETLRSLGLEVIVLESLPNYPDSYFVEDAAIITPEIAVVTNPGARARRGEEQEIEPVLSQYRETTHIQAPGTLDGGDVLLVEKQVFIGISERTNLSGANQLGQMLEHYGYSWTTIPVGGGLHLKSSVNYIGANKLFLSQQFYDHEAFQAFEKIIVDDEEIYAANTLWVNNHLITPKGFPKTKNKLTSLGFPIIQLDVSEARKMDGGLTCMSLRF